MPIRNDSAKLAWFVYFLQVFHLSRYGVVLCNAKIQSFRFTSKTARYRSNIPQRNRCIDIQRISHFNVDENIENKYFVKKTKRSMELFFYKRRNTPPCTHKRVFYVFYVSSYRKIRRLYKYTLK